MTDETPVAYVSLDPGETTGFAFFDAKGEVIKYGQYIQADQHRWLDKFITTDLQGVIVEDYRNYAWQKQARWSRNQTSKNIGAIEMVCAMRDVPVFLQPAHHKSIGYKWAGLVAAPSNHSISHQYDAIAHGVYFLTIKNIRSATLNVHD